MRPSLSSDAMQATRPGRGEWEVQAEIEYVFRRGGARSPGYTSIVGSGSSACVLHYVANNRRMQDGELLLVDAGAEVGYYTGDTFVPAPRRPARDVTYLDHWKQPVVEA